jgi:putative transposase
MGYRFVRMGYCNNNPFLNFVTLNEDSKKVLGYKIDTNMRVQLVKDILQMAVNKLICNNQNTIHHSDRGMQYCCPDFSEFAKSKGIILSTTQNPSLY